VDSNTQKKTTERENAMSDAAAILGIPIDKLTMEDAVSIILEMISRYASDQRPRYVATVNVDFITNIHSWQRGRTRHPELKYILRKADMVTADGMPIVWAARCLGASLPMRVAGSDLVPRLAEVSAQTGKSIYFLGGRRFEMTAHRAARELRRQHPGLKVAGVDAPWVHTAGEALDQAENEDKNVVEKINAARPDILLVAFGSPKQEIWFDRNRHRLKVPVTIGVGAAFDFEAGTTARAPQWMQRSGLEWIFRLCQEPKRLWKRYLVDFLKFGKLILPSVFSHWFETVKRFFPKTTATVLTESHDSPARDTLVVSLPRHLNASALSTLPEGFQTASEISFDFSNVRRIDTDGIGTLARRWQQAEAAGKLLSLRRVSPAHQKYLFRNLMADLFTDTADTSFTYLPESLPGNISLVGLSGILDTRRAGGLDYRKLLEDIGPRDCIFDMSNLSYIGSSGLMLMLKLSKYILGNGNCFVVSSPKENARQMFRMTDLQRLFVIRPDNSDAQSFIHDVRGERES
jgi:exopolysaccharide biosynthesis WecB/TagA/CpsF family protein/anti-anti-sigma factor